MTRGFEVGRRFNVLLNTSQTRGHDHQPWACASIVLAIVGVCRYCRGSNGEEGSESNDGKGELHFWSLENDCLTIRLF
jgi:hypothetical protein